MDQISENQCSPSLVHSQPPIPTLSPSATADTQCRRCGSDNGLVGVDCIQAEARLGTLYCSLVRVTEAVGSAFRRPRQDCKAFLPAFLQARRACVCSASLASLSGSRLTVSERKLNFQPHHTSESPRAAFFHEIGLLRQKKYNQQRQL